MKMSLAASVNQTNSVRGVLEAIRDRFKTSTILPDIALVVDLHYYNQDIKAMGLHSG